MCSVKKEEALFLNADFTAIKWPSNECNICGASFKSKATLRKHIKRKICLGLVKCEDCMHRPQSFSHQPFSAQNKLVPLNLRCSCRQNQHRIWFIHYFNSEKCLVKGYYFFKININWFAHLFGYSGTDNDFPQVLFFVKLPHSSNAVVFSFIVGQSLAIKSVY